jgi:hypothetical protein
MNITAISHRSRINENETIEDLNDERFKEESIKVEATFDFDA